MNRETFRMVGALLGLAVGLITMTLLGMGGIVPAAIFGAGGCVVGGIGGERMHDWSQP